MPPRTRRFAAFLLALWALVAAGFTVALGVTESLTWRQAMTAGTLSALPAALLGALVPRWCKRVPWRDQSAVRFMLHQLVGAAAYSIIWAAVIVAEMWLGTRPEAVRGFIEQGLSWQLLTGAMLYAMIAGATYASTSAARADESERMRERAEMLRLRAELSALRSRLDPHFLFNVLQTLGALIDQRPRDAHAALEHLAALLKRRTDSLTDQDDSVPFAHELADAREYLALESLRYGDRLAVDYAVEPATLAHMMPAFTLQPLVENAIRHGLAERERGGRLVISSEQNGASWTLSVSDNGVGALPEQLERSGGVGLSVLRERMRLRFGDRAVLRAASTLGNGCTVTVRLPTEAGDA